MIDNQTKTMALIEKIKAELPISAIPTTYFLSFPRSGVGMPPVTLPRHATPERWN